eukprot:359447-Chlamydomonas_euryale.AAC.6
MYRFEFKASAAHGPHVTHAQLAIQHRIHHDTAADPLLLLHPADGQRISTQPQGQGHIRVRTRWPPCFFF